ncbi:MAG TPA: GNAT family N-acetyltransferase [Gaiellaceae bacterium]|nr:GNAT family N-acetyltransferase [Gaiellaceae bacterium]
MVIEPDLEQMIAFCGREPVERVFLYDMAIRQVGRFLALVDDDGDLTSLCHLGTNLVPSGEGCAVFAGAAGRARARMIIGEEGAVSELWAAAEALLPAPREDRPGQPVYTISEPPVAGESGLRAATEDDLERLMPACAAAHEEELGVDPLAHESEGFRWRTRDQIDRGASWLWLEDDVVLFKAEVSAWSPDAAQIAQVWVDPEARRRGYAARGMRDLCRLLLETTPTVTLFVRAENAPAIRLYESIGMRRELTYRSILFP